MTIRPVKLAVVTLFLYSAAFSFALAYGALRSGLQGQSILPFILFFPVLYYFLRELLWQARSATAYRDDNGRYLSYFRLVPFLAQGNTLLYLTLLLYLAALVLTYLRYHDLLAISISI
jgi:hypothetical protein